MKEKIQKFGGAMFTPVMLFSFSGIILALTIIFMNPMIMGPLAQPDTGWYKFWDIVSSGFWTVFNNLELLFVIALPIGLAKKSLARISMESFVIYTSFNYFTGSILKYFGKSFGINYNHEAVPGSGMKMIGGIKTLDTGIVGAIIVALMVVYIHDHYFDKKVPDWLAMFNGSSLVVFIGMLASIILAVIFCLIWPLFQQGMAYTQSFFVHSGGFGIWCYSLLERLLLPTGLHHLLTQPFSYGPVIVDNGLTTYWLNHLVKFSKSTQSLAQLAPGMGFKLYGQNKVFAAPAVAAALYMTAKPKNRKKIAAIVIPAALSAVVGGITEPLEFTFLFVAPVLYVIYAVLCATLTTAMYLIGLRGDFTSGIITWLAKDWIPLWPNHYKEFLAQIAMGLLFTVIFFVVFYFVIKKFDFQTPGRQDDGENKLYTKKDYQAKKKASADDVSASTRNSFQRQAQACLEGLGGPENIVSVTNCATRLRVTVQDLEPVLPDAYFMEQGALGVVHKQKNIQVIIGVSVPQVKDEFDKLL
ncbi:PTS transporter subunit EIIC [Lactobacillus sp. DCY120]|uniref:PTS transporter subunit EIIC n=1 Tax=Bombilactobacillus apium TaxID=2675299 RepID=A0A850R1L6_9LACO|nr:alpha-glucoside-specific PTS transporter subunit IIBC [Bombilactobacillus apium]NVY96250.1 PTS transporter subunit EIIC [Bombilactobacillus apium]